MKKSDASLYNKTCSNETHKEAHELYDYRRGFQTDKVSHVVFLNNDTREIARVAEVVKIVIGDVNEVADLTWEPSGSNLDGARGFFNGHSVIFLHHHPAIAAETFTAEI